MTDRYFIRAIKYFIYLAVIFSVIYAILIITGQTTLSAFSYTLHSDRVWWLVAAFILLPAAQPSYGYVRRGLRGRMVTEENRRKVLETMEAGRYVLVNEVHDTMTFRAATTASRLRLLYEDKITVTLDKDKITIEGPRKEVVKTEFRLKTFL